MESAREVTVSELQYQGRKASRAKSEQRRRLILEATMRIIVRDGVRGVRHRAIASEADVPLAATTYYFKDIRELIADAFTLYTEWALGYVNRFTEEFEAVLPQLYQMDLTDVGEQERAVQFLANELSRYCEDKLATDLTMLISEQALRYEACIDDRVKQLAQMHREALFDIVSQFLTALGSDSAAEDSDIVMALFQSLEYQMLLDGDNAAGVMRIQRVIVRFVRLLMPQLKPLKNLL